MTTEFSPPYRPFRSIMGWYVINSHDGFEAGPMSERDAIALADQMNRDAEEGE